MSLEIELLNKVNALIDIVNSQSKTIEGLRAKVYGQERLIKHFYVKQSTQISEQALQVLELEKRLEGQIDEVENKAWHWSLNRTSA